MVIPAQTQVAISSSSSPHWLDKLDNIPGRKATLRERERDIERKVKGYWHSERSLAGQVKEEGRNKERFENQETLCKYRRARQWWMKWKTFPLRCVVRICLDHPLSLLCVPSCSVTLPVSLIVSRIYGRIGGGQESDSGITVNLRGVHWGTDKDLDLYLNTNNTWIIKIRDSVSFRDHKLRLTAFSIVEVF